MRIERWARTAAYGLAVGLVSTLVFARRVHADVREATREASSLVLDLPTTAEGTTRLSINGERVDVTAMVVPRPLDDVARAVEKGCRVSARAEGSILCLADGDDRSPMFGRVRAFAATRDLAALGVLRHVTMTPVEGGTRVIVASLPGSFPLDRAFPTEGDAPGHDGDLPRPRDARRLLTAHAEGSPHVVRVYEARGEADVVEAEARGALEARGYRALDHGVFADEGGHTVVLRVRGERTGRVFVSTIDAKGESVGVLPAPRPIEMGEH